jgi:hypothetical protein
MNARLNMASSSIFQKNDMTKRLEPFDIRKVSESKKYMQKQENLLHSVKTK